MNSAPPKSTLTMRDLRQMTETATRSAQQPALRSDDVSTETLSGAAALDVPPRLQPWLLSAALQAEVGNSAAVEFSTRALVTLGSTQVLMFSREVGPATEWWLQAYLQPPAVIATHQWHEMLLWANSVAPALDHCSLGLSEAGTAVVSLRIPFHLEGDVQALSGALALLDCLSDSLVLGLAHQPSPDAPPMTDIDDAPPLDVSGQVFREQLKQRTDRGAAQALKLDWHQALVDEMLSVLDISRGQPLSSVSAITLLGRSLEIMADGDGCSLLISTLIKRPLRTAAQCNEALRMNLHLMTLAGACIALDPKGSRLLTRWDSTGLDGQALADTLMSFVMLAVALESSTQPTAPTHSLNARSF